MYGSHDLAQPFMDAFSVKHVKDKNGGKLSLWMAENAEAGVLVELPRNPKREGYVQDCVQKLITALDAWFAAQ